MENKKVVLKVEQQGDGVRTVVTGSTSDVFALYGHACCGVFLAFLQAAKNEPAEMQAQHLLDVMLAGVIGGIAQAFKDNKVEADMEPHFRKAIAEMMPTMVKDTEYFFSDEDEEEHDEDFEVDQELLNKVRKVAEEGAYACDKNDLDTALFQLVKLGAILAGAKGKRKEDKEK